MAIILHFEINVLEARQKILIVGINLALFFLNACSQPPSGSTLPSTPSHPKTNPETHPSPQPPNPNEESWKITFLSSCSYGSIFLCLGGFGFTIDETGRYQIGPGPNNEVLIDRVETVEFKSIADFFPPGWISKMTNTPQRICVVPPSPIEVSMDKVDIQSNGVQTGLIQSREGNLCFDKISPQVALPLYYRMKSLASKYYHLPFPSR